MSKLTVEFKYNFGEIVFIKTDIDQIPRMVLEMSVAPRDSIQYRLGGGDMIISWHYEMELSRDKDVLITSSN